MKSTISEKLFLCMCLLVLAIIGFIFWSEYSGNSPYNKQKQFINHCHEIGGAIVDGLCIKVTVLEK